MNQQWFGYSPDQINASHSYNTAYKEGSSNARIGNEPGLLSQIEMMIHFERSRGFHESAVYLIGVYHYKTSNNQR